jgi:hypothetical protein
MKSIYFNENGHSHTERKREKGEQRGVHSLKMLFCNLRDDTQNSDYQKVGLPKDVFNEKLNSVSHAFVEWRYGDKSLSIPPVFIIQLGVALHTIARTLVTANPRHYGIQISNRLEPIQ